MPVECATFDRVLLFLEAHARGGAEAFNFDIASLEAMAQARAARFGAQLGAQFGAQFGANSAAHGADPCLRGGERARARAARVLLESGSATSSLGSGCTGGPT